MKGWLLGAGSVIASASTCPTTAGCSRHAPRPVPAHAELLLSVIATYRRGPRRCCCHPFCQTRFGVVAPRTRSAAAAAAPAGAPEAQALVQHAVVLLAAAGRAAERAALAGCCCAPGGVGCHRHQLVCCVLACGQAHIQHTHKHDSRQFGSGPSLGAHCCARHLPAILCCAEEGVTRQVGCSTEGLPHVGNTH